VTLEFSGGVGARLVVCDLELSGGDWGQDWTSIDTWHGKWVGARGGYLHVTCGSVCNQDQNGIKWSM